MGPLGTSRYQMLRDDRLATVIVGALISYALLETARAYAMERQERWRSWYASFVKPFMVNPGRREFLRESLLREEMTLRKVVIDGD